MYVRAPHGVYKSTSAHRICSLTFFYEFQPVDDSFAREPTAGQASFVVLAITFEELCTHARTHARTHTHWDLRLVFAFAGTRALHNVSTAPMLVVCRPDGFQTWARK